jgi:hypothetical protein
MKTTTIKLEELPKLIKRTICNYNIIISGSPGVGKTYTTRECLKHFKKGQLYTEYKMSEINRLYIQDQNVLDRICKNKYLFIDDIGAENTQNKIYGSQYFTFSTLIQDYIYEQKNNYIFTTNLTLDQLKQKYDDRVLSRLLENTVVIIINGQDLRHNLIPNLIDTVQREIELNSDIEDEFHFNTDDTVLEQITEYVQSEQFVPNCELVIRHKDYHTYYCNYHDPGRSVLYATHRRNGNTVEFGRHDLVSDTSKPFIFIGPAYHMMMALLEQTPSGIRFEDRPSIERPSIDSQIQYEAHFLLDERSRLEELLRQQQSKQNNEPIGDEHENTVTDEEILTQLNDLGLN